MDKRSFLKTSSTLALGGMINMVGSSNQPDRIKNWAGNLTYGTDRISYPKQIDEVREIIRRSRKIKSLGSRHSFSRIADSQHHLISLQDLDVTGHINKETSTVEVGPGLRYGDICTHLDESGFALHNLASLPHISIAGATATATHGSGVNNGSLSTAVVQIEMVKANGEVVEFSREKDGELFDGMVVGLGALGVVTRLVLDLKPSFQMHQHVYLNMPMAVLATNFEAVMSAGYSVSLFTDWKNKNINEVWVKEKTSVDVTNPSDELFGAVLANENVHPIITQPSENCTDQMGVEGPWYARLPHFKMGFTPSAGDELQAEYFVPFEHGFEAMSAIEKLHPKISPHLFISEIRSIAADSHWMSPFYRSPCISIHFTFKPHEKEVYEILPLIEEALSSFNVRPHWGKLFSLDPGVLQGRIKRLEDFKDLMKEMDPNEKFVNEYLQRNLLSL